MNTACVAYYRYLIYRSLKNEEMKKYWLLKSAICDAKCAINDQASLWNARRYF